MVNLNHTVAKLQCSIEPYYDKTEAFMYRHIAIYFMILVMIVCHLIS